VKFIQIAVAGVENNSETQCSLLLYALDDEGYVWEKPLGHEWYRLDLPSAPTQEAKHD
jgi:hypothetical protein